MQEYDHEGRPIGNILFKRPPFDEKLYQVHDALKSHAPMEDSYFICECGIELNYDNTEKQIRTKAYGHKRFKFKSSEYERYKIQNVKGTPGS